MTEDAKKQETPNLQEENITYGERSHGAADPAIREKLRLIRQALSHCERLINSSRKEGKLLNGRDFYIDLRMAILKEFQNVLSEL